MDLTATLGYKSVVDMLNNLDSNEYEFWLRKYEKACFGPSVNNNMLAQVALYLVSVFGGKDPNIKFDNFLMKIREIEDPEIAAFNATMKRYSFRIHEWINKKDLTRQELEGQKINNDLIDKILSNTITDVEKKNIVSEIVNRYRKGLKSRIDKEKLNAIDN